MRNKIIFGIVGLLAASVAVAGPAGAATPPSEPTNVTALQTSYGSAKINWQPPSLTGSSAVTGYVVSRDGTDSTGNGPYSTTVSGSTRSFTFTKLVSGRTYTLSVRAVSAAGTGAPVSDVVVMESAPTNFVLTQSSAAGSATMRWTPPTGRLTVTGYRVARDGVDSAGAGPYSAVLSASAASFTMTKLTTGSTYTLTVQPITGFGAGPAASGTLLIRPVWKLRSLPLPSGADATQSRLNGLACKSLTFCLAVGYYTPTGSSNRKPLVSRWNGFTWSLLSSPVIPSGWPSATLEDVACASTTRCLAVGSNGSRSFSSSWNGASWTGPVTLPLPPHATTATTASLACATTTFCMAVGSATGGRATSSYPYGARWNGTTWALSTPVDPNGTGGAGWLYTVSCPTATRCEAAGSGFYDGGSITSNALIEGWNGTSWSVQSHPGSSDGGLTDRKLTGMSCPTTSSCMAAGNSYASSEFAYGADAYSWNGSSWKYVTTPDPTRVHVADSDDPVLRDVSCISATACTLVGAQGLEYGPTPGAYSVNRSGDQYTLQAMPGAGGDAEEVSCVGGTTCVAIGKIRGSAGFTILTETRN